MRACRDLQQQRPSRPLLPPLMCVQGWAADIAAEVREEATRYGPVGHLWLDPVAAAGAVYLAFGPGPAALPAAVAFATAQSGRMFNAKGASSAGRGVGCRCSAIAAHTHMHIPPSVQPLAWLLLLRRTTLRASLKLHRPWHSHAFDNLTRDTYLPRTLTYTHTYTHMRHIA